MSSSAISTPTFQAVNANIANDGSADSPRGWAVSTDADYTFTATSASRVRCSGLTAQRTVTLPTTGIKAGAEFEILVTGATITNYLLLNSSGGNEVDRIEGEGKITVAALQDAPTTAAHWQVKDISDLVTSWLPEIQSTTSWTTTTYSVRNGRYLRTKNTVTFVASATTTAINGTGGLRMIMPKNAASGLAQVAVLLVENHSGATAYTSMSIQPSSQIGALLSGVGTGAVQVLQQTDQAAAFASSGVYFI